MNQQATEELFRSGLLWPADCTGSLSRERQGDLPLRVSVGAQAIDSVFCDRGLQLGAVHEFSLLSGPASKQQWQPPLLFLSAILHNLSRAQLPGKALYLWIGEHTWPTPQLLAKIAGTRSEMFSNYWFLSPQNKEQRLWAALKTLASPVVRAVIVDARSFSFLATRRLQLAAKRSGALCLLVRPPEECSCSSAARTKWQLKTIPSKNKLPAWTLTLLKAPGLAGAINWKIALRDGISDAQQTDSFDILSQTDGRSTSQNTKTQDREFRRNAA